jgi:N-acetylneuraminic acid mutarotase
MAAAQDAKARPALASGRSGRRAFFGFFDADGWSWAAVKALIWFLLLIVLLGYVPDRAYYFTVNRTIDIGIQMLWSPVNLCPSENRGLPCPAPPGSVVPWQGSPAELALPAARTAGASFQLGTHLLYIGGSDGQQPTATTYTTTVQNGNFGKWADGPALPAARSDFASATLSGIGYVIGGLGADGKATTTVWSLGTTGDKGDLGAWAEVKNVTLPEPRSGAMAVAVTDGILVAGGRDADGKPSAKVWKATVDSKGALGKFVQQADLLDGVADAGIALVGEYVWIWGGTDTNGPTDTVQVGHFGAPGTGVAPGSTSVPAASGAVTATPTPAAASAAPGASPGATAAPTVVLGVQQWATSDRIKLPAKRTGGASFAANGAIYLAGGSDGTSPQSQLYWAVPDAVGGLPNQWQHLDVTDLPAGGLQGGAAVVAGPTAVVIGGQTTGGLVTSSLRASLAPIPPFFQLGLFDVVVPALQFPGEIGQQLGYLAAAGASMVNFAIFVALGWAFNHKPVVRAWWERRRSRRRGRAA